MEGCTETINDSREREREGGSRCEESGRGRGGVEKEGVC